MASGIGFTDRFLTHDEMKNEIVLGMQNFDLKGKRVLIIIPDGTRTMPMPEMFVILQEVLEPVVAKLDYLVALGTHQPMSDAQFGNHIGQIVVNGVVGNSHIFNHLWAEPQTFVTIGSIPAEEIDHLTGGLMRQDVPVSLNGLILAYDHLMVCGPVFPHEVVGFSGGNKYFFPGIGGPEIINFTHWLGAVMTNYNIIGAGYTPVRAVIDRAAVFIQRPTSCIALVTTHEGVAGIYVGTPQAAWEKAAALSAKKHIVYTEKPFKRVLSIMPHLYDDLWTAAKGMYKMEPALADGGEVVIYAPHITEVSYTHGKLIDEIGYHVRDYFLKQWDQFKHYPGGVLAHSTHVKGMGEFDAVTKIETPRVQVTLATGIPEERCRKINLGYLNPALINVHEWEHREDEGVLVVPRAGEMLYRLQDSQRRIK